MARHASLPGHVTDVRSNRPEQLEDFVKCIGRSARRRAVFEAIYYHKQQMKSVSEIVDRTRVTMRRPLSRKQVLMAGNALVKCHLVGQDRKLVGDKKETAYVQDSAIQGMKARILRELNKPPSRRNIVTKRSPRIAVILSGRSSHQPRRAVWVTVDSIDSFDNVRGVAPVVRGASSMSESRFKEGLKRIIGELGRFKDWGGEQNDIFTTALVVSGKRRRTAFALKGPGKKGILKLRNMGKNGDQVHRLLESPAEVFIVQYHGQIDQAIIAQMEKFARLRAIDTEARIWYGVIDGRDSNRLIAAYPSAFGRRKARNR